MCAFTDLFTAALLLCVLRLLLHVLFFFFCSTCYFFVPILLAVIAFDLAFICFIAHLRLIGDDLV